MGYQDMVGVATRALHTNKAGRHAPVVLLFVTPVTRTATGPRVDQAVFPDWDGTCIWPCAEHGAVGLMPEGHG